MCRDIETSKRLIYECINVLLIWRLLGGFLSFDVKWKHIVIYKMYFRLEKKDENEEGLNVHLKSSLLNYASVLRLKYRSTACYITAFANICNDITVCMHIYANIFIDKLSTERRPILQ